MTEQRRVFGSQTYCNYTIKQKQALAAKVKECKQAYDNNLEELEGKTYWDAKCKRHVPAVLNTPVIMLYKKNFFCSKKQAAFFKTNIRTSPRFFTHPA